LTPKAKAKNKEVKLHQTRQLLHSKENHQQNEKATYRMGENICKSYIGKGLIPKIEKELLQPCRKPKRKSN